jgi:hypothetical protein
MAKLSYILRYEAQTVVVIWDVLPCSMVNRYQHFRVEASQIRELSAYIAQHQPSDYCLFCSRAQFLRGKKFQTVADVEVAAEEFFASKDKEWFYQAFKELAEKWVKTIEHEGLYFEY